MALNFLDYVSVVEVLVGLEAGLGGECLGALIAVEFLGAGVDSHVSQEGGLDEEGSGAHFALELGPVDLVGLEMPAQARGLLEPAAAGIAQMVSNAIQVA